MQLHENIDIYYCVDGYIATLSTNDGNSEILSGKGKSLILSIVELSRKMKTLYPLGITVEQLRKEY